MKSIIVKTSTILAAAAALALLPVSAVATGANALMAIGILAIFVADCRRTIKPLIPAAPAVAFYPAVRAPARLSAAA